MTNDLLAQMRFGFRQEARELLQELNSVVLALESEPEDRELLDRAFRGVHTLKGSGGTAGMKELSAFAHKLEEIFTAAREGKLQVNSEITDCTLKSLDLIEQMVETEGDLADRSKIEVIEAALANLLPNHAAATLTSSSATVAAVEVRHLYRILFKPHTTIFYSGTDPKNLLDELFTLGQCRVTARLGELPALDQMDPEKCYLAWEIELISSLPEEKIREVFAFVEFESELNISASACDETSRFDNPAVFTGDALRDFFAEGQEQLTGVEESLLMLESNPSAAEPLDGLFRCLHNLKGNAGVLLSERTCDLPPNHPLFYIQRVGHASESLVEEMRANGQHAIEPEKIELLFAGLDILKKQVSSFDRNLLAPVDDNELLKRFGLSPDLFARHQSPAPEKTAAAIDFEVFSETANQCFEVLGTALAALAGGAEDAPSLWKTCSRSLKTLIAAANFQALGPLSDLLRPVAELLDKAPAPSVDRIPWLQTQLQKAMEWVRQLRPVNGHQAIVTPTDTCKPSTKQSPGNHESRAAHASIRVDQEKLDKLMRVVGELLVARGALPLLAQKISRQDGMTGTGQEVKEIGGTISRIADELQSTVMGLRMMPLRTVFQKFPRMIRDLARSMNKEVSFQTSGEDIEMDKTVLEQIGDPLMHLLRNAVDHGLETSDKRKSKGKPTTGAITLSAANEANNVIIRVSDDGNGLDAELLKSKAVTKGIITSDQARELNDQQAYQLIFSAGFSTAEKVTDVSGRGVGMDVVKTNLRHLHGSIEIDTRPGQGTTFLIRLPTSLMVSQGILIKSADEEYILPMDNARDLVKVQANAVRSFRDQKMAHVRGRVFPVASLDELLDSSKSHTSQPRPELEFDDQTELPVAIIQANDFQYGLIVDRFVTEVEVIIKPLSGELAHLRMFLGATIMGDGRLVLVLNPAELFQYFHAENKKQRTRRSETTIKSQDLETCN